MHIMFKLLIFITISLSIQTASASVESDVAQGQQNTGPALLPPAYPAWPDREIHRETIPAPPSGPYMSTGLSNRKGGFSGGENRNPRRVHSPLFKTMPWPERRRPPQQWMPENGQYNYAPGNMNAPRPVQNPVPSGWYGNGYRPVPEPQWQPMRQPPPQYRYR